MRRRDLLLVGAGAAAVRGAAPVEVLIVGAGMAGLAAGLQLKQAGYRVTIVEGQLRPGGRVQTLREPFSDGVSGEAGAVRIPDIHDLTLRYVKQFGLALEPFHAPGLDTLYYVRGERVRLRTDRRAKLPYALRQDEAALSVDDLWSRYVGKLTGLDGYDGYTMSRYLAEQGASAEAIELLLLDYRDRGASALWTLQYEALLTGTKRYYRIKGGNDRLPKAMAARLAGEIRYGCVVRAMGQGERGVAVVVERGGERETLRADRLICTLPASVLQGVEWLTPLPADKQKAIDDAVYSRVSRGYLQTRSKFWQRQGLDGFATTDLPVYRLWPGGGEPGEGRGLLHSYVWHEEADALQSLGESERVRATLREAMRVYPELGAEFEGGASKCWMEDGFARGAFIEFRPGQTLFLQRVLPRAEGRLHFAGEHTSRWFSWMQGAIESGHRAAREVISAER